MSFCGLLSPFEKEGILLLGGFLDGILDSDLSALGVRASDGIFDILSLLSTCESFPGEELTELCEDVLVISRCWYECLGDTQVLFGTDREFSVLEVSLLFAFFAGYLTRGRVEDSPVAVLGKYLGELPARGRLVPGLCEGLPVCF